MLTERQQQVLEYIRQTVAARGYPPSVREIGEAIGLSSPSTVHSHLSALVSAGAIKRDPTKPRAIMIVDEAAVMTPPRDARVRDVPVLGRIAAGTPILAAEHVEEVLPLPVDLVGNDPVFLLEVKGDSMIDAGILEGDLVAIRSQKDAHDGEIVAALIDGEEATVKRLRRRDGKVILEAENPAYEPMVYTDGVELVGKVVGRRSPLPLVERSGEDVLCRAGQPGVLVRDLHLTLSPRHFDRDRAVRSVEGDSCGRHHASATGERLTHSPLPDPHLHPVSRHRDHLDVATGVKPCLARHERPDSGHIDRIRVLDHAHRMRIPGVDQSVDMTIDGLLTFDEGGPDLPVDKLRTHPYLPDADRCVDCEIGAIDPTLVVGVAGYAAQPVSAHLGRAPVGVPVVHHDGRPRRHDQDAVGADTEASVAEPEHILDCRFGRPLEHDEVVAQSLHLGELEPAQSKASKIRRTRWSGSSIQGIQRIRGSR